MTEKLIREIQYMDDSDDEAFLSGLLLKKQKIAAKLMHHTSFDQLRRVLKSRDPAEPMLIMVDLNMPLMNGVEVIRNTLEDFADPHLFIGICSGSEDPADKLNAKEAGAHFFVQKPLDVTSLKRVCEICEPLTMQRNNSEESALVCVI
ncbi:MAG: response regulator [Ahrensia sp.]|nr:response regulator [Ahrensia sp.]